MEICFLNHSSFLLRSGPVNLLVDPWFRDRVFLDGWDLLCPTPFTDQDFSSITHIWISHEHPDHFHLPTLKRIPPADKRRIVVLFPKTPDGRVARFLRAQGFAEVIEMTAGKAQNLGGGVMARCGIFGEIDSWLYVSAGGKGILNTNDCGIRSKQAASEVLHAVSGPIDLLLTQFSYAYWKGNSDQKRMRELEAAQKLEYMKLQLEVFQPKQVVPIASYIWFCHEENFYLNDSVNTPRRVFEALEDHGKSKPVILYPGESHVLLEHHDSERSLLHYESLYANTIRAENCVKGKIIEPPKLEESAEKFLTRLRSMVPWWLAKFLRPATIFLSDRNQVFSLSLRGFVPSVAASDSADISCSSESLDYCFRFSWGIDTLGINGRYLRPPGGNYQRFYNYFRFDLLRERGIKVGLRYVIESFARKILATVGLHTP